MIKMFYMDQIGNLIKLIIQYHQLIFRLALFQMMVNILLDLLKLDYTYITELDWQQWQKPINLKALLILFIV